MMMMINLWMNFNLQTLIRYSVRMDYNETFTLLLYKFI